MSDLTSKNQIIRRVRSIIGDTGGTPQFEDSDISDKLDFYRRDLRYAPMRAEQTIGSGGTVSYHDFYAPCGWLASNPTVVDATWGTVVPTTSDHIRGYYYFGTAPTRPLSISVSAYDPYAAAADLLEDWAAAVKSCVDFQSDDRRFALSQQYKQMMEQAKACRRKAQPMTAQMVRNDVSDQHPESFLLPVRH